jgi:hypothetical protein
MNERTQVWSCGGGTQSAAIAAMILRGRLPVPDLAVIVDTGREKTSTWNYLDTVLNPALEVKGFQIQRVKKGDFATVDLVAKSGEGLLMPVFTTQGGTISKLPAYCSVEWKRRVVMRWLRSLGVERASNWIGISTDEMQRVRAPQTEWFQEWYPLIFETRMSRQDCIAAIQEMGWPEAPRSSCWCCPNMRDNEWAEMKRLNPADFDAAVALEAEIREKDPHAWLHESAKPLSEVEFDSKQMALGDTGCASGMCWV